MKLTLLAAIFVTVASAAVLLPRQEDNVALHNGSQPLIPAPEPIICPAVIIPCPARCPTNCIYPMDQPCPYANRPSCPVSECLKRPCPRVAMKPCPAACPTKCVFINELDPCCPYSGTPQCA